MPKQSESKKNGASSKRIDPAIIIAVITVIGTLITAIFASPVLIALIQKTPPPTITSAETLAPSSTPTLTAAIAVATDTPPTTPPPTSTPTTTPTVIAGQDFQSGCINANLWTPYTTNLLLSQALSSQNGCWQILEMGLSAQDKGLLLSNQGATESGTYGIVTSIPQNAAIEFVVKVVRISDGELKFGVVSGPSPSSDFEGVFMAMRDGGVLGFRTASGSEEKNVIAYTVSYYPGTYKFRFDLAGIRLTISRDGSTIDYKPMDITFSTRLFFIGYQVNKNGSVEADISGLAIQQK